MFWIAISSICYFGFPINSRWEPQDDINKMHCIQTAVLSTSPITAKAGETVYGVIAEDFKLKKLKDDLGYTQQEEREAAEREIKEHQETERMEMFERFKRSNPGYDEPYVSPSLQDLEARITKLEKCGCIETSTAPIRDDMFPHNLFIPAAK